MEDKTLFDFIMQIKNTYENSPNYNNYRDLKLTEDLKSNKKYLFKPLEDIKDKKGNIKEKRNGFLVYSKETIDKNKELYDLYEKDYKNINKVDEINIFRFYYYEKLNNNNRLHATIIMINPAFANSKKTDPTIRNIKSFFKNGYDNFGSFDIINLYPIRMPKSGNLVSYLKKIRRETAYYRKFVKAFLLFNNKNNDGTKILIASWGETLHDKAIKVFKGNHFKAFGLSKQNAPLHFRRYSFLKKEIEEKIKKGIYKMAELDA